ncbi:hypothetical protein SNOG_13965 [Parastagonospora nodorum SN15]|uniref:Uncharacterized protein n=1 Tax=Phaeosphaeria nodorum (strain SN15 / ATCC MYA-4574 / FGSC 10173) TaxID=321614 RepID=Q0U2U0_PHANO|nr:hypothetical protein SNOG_13965 [Parastagonospora nodorum SN15]EAT78590.1 hypothetical protein SNOG_13965 [Parastagonospora nodorum SN15]
MASLPCCLLPACLLTDPRSTVALQLRSQSPRLRTVRNGKFRQWSFAVGFICRPAEDRSRSE